MPGHRLTRRATLAAGFAPAGALAAPSRAGPDRAAPDRAWPDRTWPDRPIRWIVAYAAGGGTDALARILAASMAPRLGQPIVIDNRPGAATNIGAHAAANAPPDGHTLLSADNGTLVNNPALFNRLPYDPVIDFRPLGLMARFPLVLAVPQGSALEGPRAFVEAARARPREVTYGSPGTGSPHHLTMARLAREAGGLQLTHVPYRGAALALNDLLAGTVESMILDLAAGGEPLRSGRVRPLAICSAARHPDLPEVPTVREALGLPGFEAFAWQALVAPAQVPDAVAARITAALATALAEPAVQDRLRGIGLEPLTGGPAEARALMEAERKVWVPLIRALNITLD